MKKTRTPWARTFPWTLVIWAALGTNAWGQGRRAAAFDVPLHVVWHDDVDDALEAQAAGMPVLAFDGAKKRWHEVPESVRALTELRYLIVSKNKLHDLPPWLPELANLTVILADHNRMEAFPEVLLRMPNLVQISLGENFIQGIPLDIDALQNLRFLALWGNVLAQFPASLGNLERLEVLDLIHNDMTVEEQDMVTHLLPGVRVLMSPPCLCEFDLPPDD